MNTTETESLRLLLERQERLATEHGDARARVAAARFLRFLSSNPQLANVLEESINESWEARMRHITDCRALLAAVRAVIEKAHAELGSYLIELSPDGSGPYAAIVRELLDEEEPVTAWRACKELEQVFDASRESLRDLVDEGTKEVQKNARKFVAPLRRLQNFYKRSRLRLRIGADVLVGEAYASLLEHVGRLQPRVVADHKGRRVVFEPDMNATDEVWKHIDEARLFPSREREVTGEEICVLIRRVSVGLQTALVTRSSQRALLRRFAARCESFEAKRIRAGAKRAVRRVEAELTLELARYLFDAGYSPVLSPDVSGLRPDVVSVRHLPALYVEVKQYSAATNAALCRAVSQVRHTWQLFAKRFDTPEAVLLVFRLDGRPLDLPPELSTSLGRLIVEVVDVGPRAKSGSRALAPLTMSAEDLLAPAPRSRAPAVGKGRRESPRGRHGAG
jgi:hypothetical protein